MQWRVRFAALLQFVEHGRADLATTAAICPGTDRWDLEVALASLLGQRSIEEPIGLEKLLTLAEDGKLALTALGRLRLDEDDV
jgi:hypothetical protein